VYTKKEIEAIAAVCEEAGIYVIADEIYEKLVYGDEKPYSIANYSEKMKDLTITVNGVSKTYAMTGWRIGYLAAPKDVAKAIDSFQSHATSNPNSIAQYATLAALNASAESVDKMVAVFADRRKKMMARLDKMQGVSYVKPDGAFYLMLVVGGLYGKKSGDKTIENSVDFAAELLEKEKVAVVPGISFGADDCVRLSYSLSLEDILEGLDRIETFVKSLK
jgi:aspartate aminotransferase